MKRTVPMRILFAFCLVSATTSVARAQSTTPGGMPPPPGMNLAESAAMRFPQPVRVGVGQCCVLPLGGGDLAGGGAGADQVAAVPQALTREVSRTKTRALRLNW